MLQKMTRMLTVALLLAAASGAVASHAAPATLAASNSPVAKALARPIDLDFEKTSLDNVLKYIDKVCPDLRIVIDPAVSAAGIDLSARVVDLRVRQVSVTAVLHLLLGDDLGYTHEPGCVLVTTRERVLRNLLTLTYPVDGLLDVLRREETWRRPDRGVEADATLAPDTGASDPWAQHLVDLIREVTPSSASGHVADWTECGGPATVEVNGNLLLVRQTQAGQAAIAAFLPAFEKAIEAAGRERIKMGLSAHQPVVSVREPEPGTEETQRRLREQIDLDFERTSLDNVLNYISEVQRGLNIVIDPRIQKAGIDLATRLVTLRLSKVPVAEVLRRVLACDGGLTYVPRPGYVLVTTLEVAQRPEVRLYPVAGLLSAARSAMPKDVSPDGVTQGPHGLCTVVQYAVDNLTCPGVAAWTEAGGNAVIECLAGVLVVSQSPEGNRRAADLLERLRRAMAAKYPQDVSESRDRRAEPKAVAETRRRLREPIDLDFERTSLDNVLNYISEIQRGLNIVIDPAVSRAGLDLSTCLVDLKVKRVSVANVLDRVVDRVLGGWLDYAVKPGYVLVLPCDRRPMAARVYPVADLLRALPAAVKAGRVAGARPAEDGAGALADQVHALVDSNGNHHVAPWAEQGGPAILRFFGGAMVVMQTEAGHRRVAEVLRQCRKQFLPAGGGR